MRNKKFYYLATLIVTSSMLVFTGCSKKAEPVISESVEEPEPAEEPEESLKDATPSENPANEENLEDVENEIDTSEVEEDTEEENEPDLGYEIIPMDDTIYFVKQSANVRSGPSTSYSKVGGLSAGQEITITGRVETGDSTWYVIKTDNGDTQMISGSLISTEKPVQQQPPAQNTQPQQPQQPSQPSGGSNPDGLEADGDGEMLGGDVTFDWGSESGWGGLQ